MLGIGGAPAEFLSAKNFRAACFAAQRQASQLPENRTSSVLTNSNNKMAAGGAKPGIPHRNKPTPKKGEAKTLKRKRGQEDLGKLKVAIEELVSVLLCRCPADSAVFRRGC